MAKSAKDGAQLPAVLPEPDAMERTEITRAVERTTSRRSRFRVVEGFGSGHNDGRGFSARALDAVGSTAPAFAGRVFEHIGRIAIPYGGTEPDMSSANAALAYIDGLEPENEMQALAALSIYAAQDMALTLIGRMRQNTTMHELELNGALAAKLMRAATAQTEAFAKLRRGGEQNVRVEHVHVYEGGQAIVGNVAQGGGGGRKSIPQAHRPDCAPASVTPLLGVDQAGDIVPVPGDEERAVPHTRGRKPRRADRPA